MIKKILIITTIGLLIFVAANFNEVSAAVNCLDPANAGNPACEPPRLQGIEVTIVNLIYTMWVLGIPLFGLVGVLIGFQYMTSGTDSDVKAATQKRAVYWVVGMILFFASQPIAAGFMKFFITTQGDCYQFVNNFGFTVFFSNVCDSTSTANPDDSGLCMVQNSNCPENTQQQVDSNCSSGFRCIYVPICDTACTNEGSQACPNGLRAQSDRTCSTGLRCCTLPTIGTPTPTPASCFSLEGGACSAGSCAANCESVPATQASCPAAEPVCCVCNSDQEATTPITGCCSDNTQCWGGGPLVTDASASSELQSVDLPASTCTETVSTGVCASGRRCSAYVLDQQIDPADVQDLNNGLVGKSCYPSQFNRSVYPYNPALGAQSYVCVVALNASGYIWRLGGYSFNEGQ